MTFRYAAGHFDGQSIASGDAAIELSGLFRHCALLHVPEMLGEMPWALGFYDPQAVCTRAAPAPCGSCAWCECRSALKAFKVSQRRFRLLKSPKLRDGVDMILGIVGRRPWKRVSQD